MKKFSIVAALALTCATLCFLPTGCTTAQVTTPGVGTNAPTVTTVKVPDTNAVIAVINIIVPPAVSIAVEKDPKVAQYLADASIAISVFTAGNDYSPAALSKALAQTKVKDIQTPEVQSAISSLVLMYEATYARTVSSKLPQSQYLVPILQALAHAINVGLPASPAAPPTQ